MAVTLLCAQALLAFACDAPGPVRFGFPLPAAALRNGLHLADAGARLQWRPLQERPDANGRLWVELAVVGVRGRTSVRAGGAGPVGAEGGDVVRVESEEITQPDRRVLLRRWRWCTGEVDRIERITFDLPRALGDEAFAEGESLTTCSAELLERCLSVRIAAADWERAGVLPRLGALARPLRERLAEAALELQELPGLRGAGDFGRSQGVVTNLEYDTALGFLRLGLALESRALMRRALVSARHLVDHDLEPSTGLPFRHGHDHRSAAPETGHAWLAGLLLAGCVAADDGLLRAAHTIASGLARHHPKPQTGEDDRARDYGWPLLELETWLAFADDPACERAADQLAGELLARWDPRNGVLRFGEGELKGGAYEERLWLTGGILLPALRAHARRKPSPRLREVIGALESRVAELVLQGRQGLPVRCVVRDGEVRSQVRRRHVPELYLLLEGIPERSLAACLARRPCFAALEGVPAPDDPDAATSFSMAARCTWVLR